MPIVRVRETESVELALRRFKRACEKAGILSELRKRESYEKPTTRRKRKNAAARNRHKKRLEKEIMPPKYGKGEKHSYDYTKNKSQRGYETGS